MERLSKPEVFAALKSIDVEYISDQNLSTDHSKDIDIILRVNNLKGNYFTKAKSLIVPTLRQKFSKLKAASSEMQGDLLISFLKDLQTCDSILKPNSRLPLIFHSNRPDED